jgi:hypothetical protein
MTDHQITPPPEMAQQWMTEFYGTPVVPGEACTDLATRAAQWGADQELDACCEWLEQNQGRWEIPMALREARRPKPPSLKEQSLALIDLIQGNKKAWDINDLDVVRRALEALPE